MSEKTQLDRIEAKFTHTIDYRCISLDGKVYTFGAKQAHCIRLLHEAWQRGTPDVAEDFLASEILDTKWPDLFRRHPAWNTVIVQGDEEGTVRLNLETPARIPLLPGGRN
jgi:hypothetical protein